MYASKRLGHEQGLNLLDMARLGKFVANRSVYLDARIKILHQAGSMCGAERRMLESPIKTYSSSDPLVPFRTTFRGLPAAQYQTNAQVYAVFTIAVHTAAFVYVVESFRDGARNFEYAWNIVPSKAFHRHTLLQIRATPGRHSQITSQSLGA